ncbi:Dos2p SCDLUD_001617 [Saccharomycodes ludwigii]|uniref:Dos2p n=1 Tax=Saccharomycodes ludwigii TaxID=36035 RepID=UPI001E83C501|nr:hypothetical protein SCDLUD_001617 [Saccharomycodes ludwigii]KAH3901834.1 hypothetical protein SCDLUD_001617 [Saccharomycodes ludwigii]
MDFLYETQEIPIETVSTTEQETVPKKKNNEENNDNPLLKNVKQDIKTEQAFSDLEQALDHGITKTTNFLYNLWNNDQKVELNKDAITNTKNKDQEEHNNTIKDKGDETATTTNKDAIINEQLTQSLLDAVDTKIMQAENYIQSNVSVLSSELSSKFSNLKIEDVKKNIISTHEKVTNLAKQISGDNQDTENKNKIAIENFLKSNENAKLTETIQTLIDSIFNTESPNDTEVKQMLSKDPSWIQLYEKVVPAKLPNDVFWSIYDDKILAVIKQKKINIVKQKMESSKNVPSWDDDDDDDDDNDDANVDDGNDSISNTAENKNLNDDIVIVEKDFARGDNMYSNSTDKENTKEGDNANDDDDDDDDWE